MSVRAQRGFTLIEVLLATTLLAMGLAVAFAAMRSSITVTTRGEEVARVSERMRMTDGFLRQRLSSALPLAMDTDPARQLPILFMGEPERMRFVADLPAYMGYGGPHMHELSVSRQADELTLQVAFTLVQGGHLLKEVPEREPETLAGGLRSVRFAYRGLDAQGALGPWQDTWKATESLPLQISVEMERTDGQVWPPLVVSLPLSRGGRGLQGGTY